MKKEEEDYEDLMKDHIDLCETLHRNWDNLTGHMQLLISDKVYNRFEP